METILAIVIGLAVIVFGALISMGNERQRRAIDILREQVVLWAMQDLRLKRERLARDIHVDDPLGWLNKVVTRVCGYELNLRVIEAVENPCVLICIAGDGSEKIVLTPHSPSKIREMKRAKHNRLSKYADQNPLLSFPRDVIAFECSTLSNGFLFDLELPLAWKGLTGNNFDEMSTMWIYMIS